MAVAASLRHAVRGTTWAVAGLSAAGLAQATHLRLHYQCPGEPVGERHGFAGRGYRGKPLRLLFVGDSIAVGVGAAVAAPLQAACANRLSSLRRQPVEWRTVAATGADVRELRALLLHSQRQLEDGLEKDKGFDIAVVLCGVNDGKKFLQGRWPSVFKEDLDALCTSLKKVVPQGIITVPRILGYADAPLLQLWPMCHLVPIFFERFEAQKTALAERGSRCWSPEPEGLVLAADSGLWAVDGIHPSAEGYRLVGEWLGTSLADYSPPALSEE
eukprot:TRINITY_DN64045_c0_g1_i1.p1 TRINITY_DN64045_c0_g1~~TRINITY_DN64045_c0_g1_i1.p1  ORF type:complete len:284 (+),score=58.50 TRINITY_DN64045_c0_g1_i1:39-854(+)